jgi:CRP/FNR family cyclic AMP-dependent transcriptional regulator
VRKSCKSDHSTNPEPLFLPQPGNKPLEGVPIENTTDLDISRRIMWEEFSSYFSKIPERSYPAGSMIAMPGCSSSERFYILKKGRVNLYRVSGNGKRLIIKQLASGVLGLRCLFGNIYRANYIEALDDCTVCIVTKEQGLEFLKQRPDLLIRLLGILFFELDEQSENRLQTAYLPVNVRLAHFLLGAVDLELNTLINFNHEEIANTIGAARQTVSIKLNQMRKQGIISIKRKLILINDRQRLEQMIN